MILVASIGGIIISSSSSSVVTLLGVATISVIVTATVIVVVTVVKTVVMVVGIGSVVSVVVMVSIRIVGTAVIVVIVVIIVVTASVIISFRGDAFRRHAFSFGSRAHVSRVLGAAGAITSYTTAISSSISASIAGSVMVSGFTQLGADLPQLGFLFLSVLQEGFLAHHDVLVAFVFGLGLQHCLLVEKLLLAVLSISPTFLNLEKWRVGGIEGEIKRGLGGGGKRGGGAVRKRDRVVESILKK